jgi:hypothetical protein
MVALAAMLGHAAMMPFKVRTVLTGLRCVEGLALRRSRCLRASA